jgi:topoisomerase-4 subunit B
VRNKKETIYCYDETEKQAALGKLGKNAEITRFKGLGEISPDEFAAFIGKDIRLETVLVQHDAKGESKTDKILEYYMGKNTPARRDFIIENLKVEEDVVEESLEDFAADKADREAVDA